uniref:Tudor domain-containing protein n=1 Tax=Davidia involucrata TaxID=16924 RepID=A0A5B7B4S2_DAVIN
MASADRELEEQLMEAGNRLLQPPSSVDELLPLLDQVENFLSRVEQSPPKSMQNALSPSVKALVAEELLRHSDVDVKVAVASCISEITRITAPDAPYDDDKMKDLFQLIVSSFENLSDKSSRSYNKRTSILETVAKVRSCVVMLDLECDGLIVEMFQHFLKAIRDHDPENVFSSMETIMTLVLEESEDISLELLSPILSSVKKDNEEVLPIARKLGERVLENCASKLKPYLTQAVKSLGLSLDDYSKVIASICEGTTSAVEHSNVDNAPGEQLADESKLARASSEGAAQADESKLATASSNEAAQVAKESVTEDASPDEVNPAIDRSPKSVMSNGVAETGNEGTSVDPEILKKPEHGDQSVNANETSKVESDDSDAGKLVKSESKPEQTSKRRGRKSNSLINSTEPSDSSRVDSEKKTERLPDRRKSRSKEIRSSPSEDPSVETAAPSETEKETSIQHSSPKASESEAINVATSSPSERLLDESRLKKAGRPKKTENLIQEASPSADVISKKASEGTSDSEVKPLKRSGKKTPAGISNEDKTPALVDTSKNEGGTTSDSEAKPLKQSSKKMDAGNNIEEGSSLKKKEDGKRRGKGKATSEKDVTKSSTKDNDKVIVSSAKSTTKLANDEGHLEETPKKPNSKRKRTPGKDRASDNVELLGANLVGSKVKVWWPKDHMFYEGVIDSFDSIKKKHRVLYTDGDRETLDFRKERWEFVGGDSNSVSDGEQATEQPSPDPSSDMHKKKKAKTNPEPSAKQGKMEVSPKRGGGAASSKLKGAATKSGRKSKIDNKVDSKSEDNISKSGGTSEGHTGGKSKDHSQRIGKSVDDAPKTTGRSKDVDGGSPKTSTKSKQDTLKTATKDMPKTNIKDNLKAATKSKAKTPRSGNKSNANGTGKVKSSSSKLKETEDLREESPDSTKTPESVKGKLPDTSKARESEAKSGKKRRRGVKS